MKNLSQEKRLLLFLICCLTLCPSEPFAQSWQWGRKSAGSVIDAWPVTSDDSGNVYCAAYHITSGAPVPAYFDTLSIPAIAVPPMLSGSGQLLWVKYDSMGNVVWADGTSTGNGWIFDIVTDNNGDLILYGAFTSATMNIGPFTLVNSFAVGIAQYFLAKVSSSGTVLWAIRDGSVLGNSIYIHTHAYFSPGGITTDAAGNIYITGAFRKPWMTIGSDTLTNSFTGLPNTHDVFVAKYTPAGVPVWATSFGGLGNDYGFDVAVSTSGNIYVTGAYYSTSMLVGPDLLTNPVGSATTGGKSQAFLAKLSPAGVPLWGISSKGNQDAVGVRMVSDDFDNIYIVGSFADDTLRFGSTTIHQPYGSSAPTGKNGVFVTKFRPSDTVAWGRAASSATKPMVGYDIARAKPCGVWIAGVYDEDAVFGTDTLTRINGKDPVFIANYDYNGNLVDFSALGTGGDDEVGIATDRNGNVFTVGDISSEGPFHTLIIATDTLDCPSFPVGSLHEYSYVGRYKVPPLPPIDTFHYSTDSSYCGTDTFIFSVPPGYDFYLWDNGATAQVRMVDTAGTYYLVSSNCGGPVRIDTFHIMVSPTDTTFSRHDTALCASGVPFAITAPTGYSYVRWNTGDTTATIMVSTSGVYIAYAISDCFIEVDSIYVTVHPLPVVNLGADTAFCLGNTYELSTSQPPGTTIFWNTGSTGDTIHVSSTGLYSVVVTDSAGCISTDSVAILVSPAPLVDIGPDTTNCEGIPVLLQSAYTYSAPAFLWSNFSTAASITASTTGTYWLQVTVAGCSAADTVAVGIIYDTFTLYNNDTAICKGQTVQVYAVGDPSLHYQWLPTTGIAFSDHIDPLIIADTSALYVITASFEGCPDKRDSFYINVQPYPSVYLGGNRHVCASDTLRIQPVIIPSWYTGYTYSWTPVLAVDFPDNPFAVFKGSDTTSLVLTVTTPAGCTGADSTMILVHPGNFASVSNDLALCPHDSAQLIATGGITYHWSPETYLSSNSDPAPWVRPITSTFYTVIVADRFDCLDTLSVFVTVHPGAVFYLTDAVTIYPGESYQISPQTNCTYFNCTPAGGLSAKYLSNPVATPVVSTRYRVKASTEFGCLIEDEIDINVDPSSSVTIPNAFSPANGNLLRIISHGPVKLNYFRIFNRWGNLVFETQHIEDGWDGSFHGIPQPVGVFVFQIDAVTGNGEVIRKQGNVTLLR